MKKRTRNVIRGLALIGLVVVTTVLTQVFLFGAPRHAPQETKAAEAAVEASAWSVDAIYVNGDRVTFEGKVYEAKWWTKGERPNAANGDGVWKPVEATAGAKQEDDAWRVDAVYNAGDRASCEGAVYEAKWWTKGEKPDAAKEWGVWRLVAAVGAVRENGGAGDFKIVGYYPDWQPERVGQIRYDQLTHINYAFAVLREDGQLRPLANPQAAKTILAAAHARGVKVLLAVGGWSYQDVPLEGAFRAATASEEKRKFLADNILAMAKAYGFDGVDIDWEYPRFGQDSGQQYVAFMEYLSGRAREDNMLLTIAVMAGKTPDGTVQYDAAAHTDAVLAAVDWINVMAYDGGDGERHSSYEFAVDCAGYWKDVRGVPAHKVVLGVPFYGRPSWLAYREILQGDAQAMEKDRVWASGSQIYYNGGATLRRKTEWALAHAGGIMVWELSQDSDAAEKSLLRVIGDTAGKRG